ncbi:unnamed protein product, partial [Didymodactylos carnosus]
LASEEFEWYDLIQAIQNIFKACSLPGLTSSYNSSLFKCEDTTNYISKHRLSDRSIDCYNSTDEITAVACSFNLSNRFQCSTIQDCISRKLLMDGTNDCEDRSDERFPASCNSDLVSGCKYFRNTTNQNEGMMFEQICDGIVEYESDGETDEMNCESWPCETKYTICDRTWSCKNGSDELDCEDSLSEKHCRNYQHYCITLDGIKCLNATFAGDNLTDCLGSSDEREFCRKNYSRNTDLRYRCNNSDKCISPLKLCDCKYDCPDEDDEKICTWIDKYKCKQNYFVCKDGSIIPYESRCDNEYDCKKGEDEWLCDLIDQPTLYYSDTKNFVEYPTIQLATRKYIHQGHKKDAISQKGNVNKQITIEYAVQSDNDPVYRLIWYCNRGILVHSANRDFCLCPQMYYGDRCQYQAEYIMISVKVKALLASQQNSIITLIVQLIESKTGVVLAYERIIHYTKSCSSKHLRTLVYPYPRLAITDFYVRIEAFGEDYVKNDGIHYLASWYFEVLFPFLPVNHLSGILNVPEKGVTIESCKKVMCNNGYCVKYINSDREYCRCYNGWQGMLCDVKDKWKCTDDSIHVTRSRSDLSPICVCASGKNGQTCSGTLNCLSGSCKNGATCIQVDLRSVEFICICAEGYYGIDCAAHAPTLHVLFGIPVPSSAIIHFLQFLNREEPYQFIVFKRIPVHQYDLTVRVTVHDEPYLPQIAYLHVFHENILKNHYYLIMLLKEGLANVTTIVKPENRCPHVKEILSSTRASYQYLKRVKYYHLPCLQKQVKCFYDEVSMCLCNEEHFAECFRFNHDLTECSDISYCENGAKCVQEHRLCPNRLLCLCADCYYGGQCQFTTAGFGLSLDTIIGQHIQPTVKIIKQTFVIKLTLGIVTVMFAFGLISNILSII